MALNADIKKTIQTAYSQFLDARELKPRYGQKLMIAEIARTLGGIELDDEGVRVGERHICVVEAGTGTGKTVAYLLAAIPVAKALGKKLVVSTATVALQEQIVYKDLPDLKRQSGLNFTFALAKGRGRYLCLSKLDRILTDVDAANASDQALYEDEYPQVDEQALTIYQSMMDALAANKWAGDKDEWADEIEPQVWSRVTTDHRQCTGRRCSNVASCSFIKSRDSLGSFDVIVANHDLVLADLALGGGAILPDPADTFYIFDEGHHLPDKALNHFAEHSRLIGTLKWLEQTNKVQGAMLGEISGAGNIDRFAEQLPSAIQDVKRNLELVYPMITQLAERIEDPDRSPRYRFEQGRVPEPLREVSVELKQTFDRLAELLGKMNREVEEALESSHCDVPKVDLETWFPQIGVWQSRAEANLALWASYAEPEMDGALPKARWITLVDFGGSIDYEICSSPILAARTLEYSLWNRCCGAVVTSATLTALGKFDRLKMRAGTPDNAHYAIVPSPFDFNKAVLRIPKMAQDASDSVNHTLAIIEGLPDLLAEHNASLVLFASRRQMLDVYDGLPLAWREHILMQGDKSKQEMISAHKQRVDDGQPSVLFGLASFAEGVDLPGGYCQHVIIAKIPFAVPDDPVEASLSEWIEARGGNPFMEITVPDAALKLVQACGRLLRTEADSGAITLLDNRLLTRRYGKAILNSLPPFRRELN
ncbi:ATP-dependent DNA helicase DinG [Simiduia aestuariiviva]|uniref:ATP-dependent DNA helicase DinG n=1 Tax=Simiduia aestuariiviva TaxID=1510459 RepID=A0A839UIS6_9GAMM|nr:ATP-dependent DNA helicase DinG [Simiduia aestuariiviva]MBB3167762.1 ATP-dependent DNA helicase DinG [Simiduia aestuariiviva]